MQGSGQEEPEETSTDIRPRTNSLTSTSSTNTGGGAAAAAIGIAKRLRRSSYTPAPNASTTSLAHSKSDLNSVNDEVDLLSPKSLLLQGDDAMKLQSFAEFKLHDDQPRKQRYYLATLQKLQQHLISRNVLHASSSGGLNPTVSISPMKKVKSKEFKGSLKGSLKSSNSSGNSTPGGKTKGGLRFFLPGTKASKNAAPVNKKSPETILHLAKLAIRDLNEEKSEYLIQQLHSSIIRKKRVYDACSLFLMAMSNRMEKTALMILDKGFPHDVNAPIFAYKVKENYADQNPKFRMNTVLFPSYFLVAVKFGLEVLVKYMLKMGADVNSRWNGITALHFACFADKGKPNLNMIALLLEYGADPLIGCHFDQVYMLYKLQASFIGEGAFNHKQHPGVFIGRDGNVVIPTGTDPSPSVFPLLSLPQKSVAVYKQMEKNKKEQLQLSPKLGLDNIQEDSFDFKSHPNLAKSSSSDDVSHKKKTSIFKKAAKALFLPNANSGAHGDSASQNKDSSDLSDEKNSNNSVEDWKKDKFVLPLSLATAARDKLAVLLILQKMFISKPRKHASIFSHFHQQLAATSTHGSANSLQAGSFTGSGMTRSSSSISEILPRTSPFGSEMTNLSQVGKDHFSLLVQQDIEIVALLLKTNVVDLYQKDPSGSTALHLAVRNGNLDLVQILLYFDTENRLLNSTGENGWTCLHEAISRRNLEMFRFLVKRGANTDITNSLGDTPADLGVRIGIDVNDVDQVWMTSISRKPKGSNSQITKDSSSTILAGADIGQEFMFQFDSKLAKMMQEPVSFEPVASITRSYSEKKKTNEKRRKTISGETSPKLNLPSPAISFTPAIPEGPSAEEQSSSEKKRTGTMRLPFTKLFSRKRAEEIKAPLPTLETIASSLAQVDYHNPDVISVEQKVVSEEKKNEDETSTKEETK